MKNIYYFLEQLDDARASYSLFMLAPFFDIRLRIWSKTRARDRLLKKFLIKKLQNDGDIQLDDKFGSVQKIQKISVGRDF